MKLSELKQLVSRIEAINSGDPEIEFYVESGKLSVGHLANDFFVDFTVRPINGAMETYFCLQESRFMFPLAPK